MKSHKFWDKASAGALQLNYITDPSLPQLQLGDAVVLRSLEAATRVEAAVEAQLAAEYRSRFSTRRGIADVPASRRGEVNKPLAHQLLPNGHSRTRTTRRWDHTANNVAIVVPWESPLDAIEEPAASPESDAAVGGLALLVSGGLGLKLQGHAYAYVPARGILVARYKPVAPGVRVSFGIVSRTAATYLDVNEDVLTGLVLPPEASYDAVAWSALQWVLDNPQAYTPGVKQSKPE